MKMAMMVILEEGKSLFQEIYQLVPFSFKFYIFLDIIFNENEREVGCEMHSDG